jgi:hypothetical protein
MLMGLPFRCQLPLPDGNIYRGDRQHLAYLYRRADLIDGWVRVSRTVLASETAPRIERWVFDWLSGGPGLIEFRCGDGHEPGPVGWLDRIQTVPHASAIPTDNYDVRLYDRIDSDLLQGVGTNRDALAAEIAAVYNLLDSTGHGWVWCSGPLRFRIENAGSYKRGAVVLTVVVPTGNGLLGFPPAAPNPAFRPQACSG